MPHLIFYTKIKDLWQTLHCSHFFSLTFHWLVGLKSNFYVICRFFCTDSLDSVMGWWRAKPFSFFKIGYIYYAKVKLVLSCTMLLILVEILCQRILKAIFNAPSNSAIIFFLFLYLPQQFDPCCSRHGAHQRSKKVCLLQWTENIFDFRRIIICHVRPWTNIEPATMDIL